MNIEDVLENEIVKLVVCVIEWRMVLTELVVSVCVRVDEWWHIVTVVYQAK
jgi:hypothetical protein